MKRGIVKKSEARLVNIWLPLELIPAIDLALEIEDTDRSKFIRNAIREKIARVVPVKEIA
jgi:metal-responsive CopG/Arc/MetJ family transcriptional regulator